MKVNLGDIILIPLSNSWNAIAKVIFSPIGDFKTTISFIILDFTQNDKVDLDELKDKQALPLNKYGSIIYQIFTGKHNIKNKLWPIVGNIGTTGEEDKYRIYQVAGALYHNETEVRLLNDGEEENYTTLIGSGFGVVDNVLVDTVKNMLYKDNY